MAATLGEAASFRVIGGRAHLPLDHAQPVLPADTPGDRLHQLDRVRMARPAQHRFAGADLRHPPRVHHADAVAHLIDHAQVVGDQQQGHPELMLEVLHQLQNLSLHGDVQGRGGLVGDHQPRPAGDGHGDHHPLAHPAGQLVGVAVQHHVRGGDAQLLQQFPAAPAGLGTPHPLVEHQGLRQLVGDGVDGVEGGHRLLENHRDLVAPDFPQHAFLRAQQFPASEADAPAGMEAGRADQAHHGERRHRFAAGRLPHQGQAFPLRDGKRDPVHRAGQAVLGVKIGLQVLYFQQVHGLFVP